MLWARNLSERTTTSQRTTSGAHRSHRGPSPAADTRNSQAAADSARRGEAAQIRKLEWAPDTPPTLGTLRGLRSPKFQTIRTKGSPDCPISTRPGNHWPNRRKTGLMAKEGQSGQMQVAVEYLVNHMASPQSQQDPRITLLSLPTAHQEDPWTKIWPRLGTKFPTRWCPPKREIPSQCTMIRELISTMLQVLIICRNYGTRRGQWTAEMSLNPTQSHLLKAYKMIIILIIIIKI